MNVPDSGFVEICGAPLSYEITGVGYPIVLLHEGFADSRMYDDQVAALGTRYRVIRYDRHGSGRSGAPAAPYTDHDALRELRCSACRRVVGLRSTSLSPIRRW